MLKTLINIQHDVYKRTNQNYQKLTNSKELSIENFIVNVVVLKSNFTANKFLFL